MVKRPARMTDMTVMLVLGAVALAIVLATGPFGATSAVAEQATPSPSRFGVIRPVDADLAAYAEAGVGRVTLEVGWDLMEPTSGNLNPEYIAEARARLGMFRSAGFDVVLDLGLQYPPPWVFGLAGETRFVDQYGARWFGSHGQDVPNAVFNPAVRAAQSSFIQRALAALGPSDFAAVRVGGLLQNEARYPSRDGSGHDDSFWAFDPAARSVSPVPNWRPGSAPADNAAFLDFYVKSLTDYEVWLTDQYQASFPGEIQVLLPAWGIRSGDISEALASGVTGASSPEQNGLISMGVSFNAIAAALGSRPNIVLYSTYLDAPSHGSTAQLMSPIEHLSELGAVYGHQVAGENSGDNSTNGALDRIDTLLADGVVGDVMWLAGERFNWPGQASLADYARVVEKHSGTACANADGYATAPAKGLVIDAAQGVLVNDTGAGAMMAVEDLGAVTASGGALDLRADGSFTYTPRDGFTGVDSFSYSVTGGSAMCDDSATVTVIVGTHDMVGLVDPTTGIWHWRDGAGRMTSFYYGTPGDYPFVGDWDCNGTDSPGLFRQSNGFVYLRNAVSQGNADVTFFFGNPGDVPLAGDFDGDGCDTLSIYRPSEARFYIINELGRDGGGLGAADHSFLFGNAGDKPVVGDWDNDKVDEIGLHRESSGFFYYRNTLSTGIATGQFYFGNPGDRLVAGDWGTVDGVETPGLFRPSNAAFYFRHTLTQGNANAQFTWTGAGNSWHPVAGDFGSS